MSERILLQLRDIRLHFPRRRRWPFAPRPPAVQALRGVDLDIREGEILAVVGESGSGKSTLGRILVRAAVPSGGTLRLPDAPSGRTLEHAVQMVFQDPLGSLNPRLRIGTSVAEPLRIRGTPRGPALRERVAECLALVGLDPAMASRRPQEFSGGQRQRICIARAIAAEPRLIVADEALSALDPSLRDRMVDLFLDLRRRLALTYVFISHDLAVVRRMADRVAVMYLGQIVELGPASALYASPRHPYTRALLVAAPVADPRAERARIRSFLPGEPPSPIHPPQGCAFHPRCPRAVARCAEEMPALGPVGEDHQAACHLPYMPSNSC
jgi:oligopeptide/dipeptide ABC transporter ATP-binding protein